MSAGGLSYSGLRNSAKVTLPSVEMWGTNMNIIQDPPKSIHTRRIDKVGQTQSILQAQDESGDRICEMINVYARGVNPMVSVSYDNYSNNSGRGGNLFANQANASLPYKVENVRPPIMRQEDLLPLSRLPRNWFYSYTNPSLPDIVQAASCNETDKCIQDKILYASAYTNKQDLMKEDFTSPRDAPGHTLLRDVRLVQAGANPSLPNSLVRERDSGSEKKSIQYDKRDVHALTNLGGGHHSRSHEKEFSSMDGRRIHVDGLDPISVDAPLGGMTQKTAENEFLAMDRGALADSTLLIPIESKKYSSQIQMDHSSDFLHKDQRQIQTNKLLYDAFSNKGSGSMGGGADKVQKDTTKNINAHKYLCMARTNQNTRENFQHPLRDADDSKIHTKKFLYKDVQSQATSVFQVQHDPLVKEKRAIHETPLHAFGQSNVSSRGNAPTLEHDTLSRNYLPNPSQPTHVTSTKSSSAIHVSSPIESINNSIHSDEDMMHYSVEATRGMQGGKQATEDSVSTFALNPHLYTSADSARTLDYGTDTYLDNAVLHRTLTQRTTGSATANKTMIGGEDPYKNHTHMSHRMQDTLPVSADTHKTFIGTLQNPLEDSNVRLHQDHKTPIHSVLTNTQSPYSHTVHPEKVLEQRRRVLLTDTVTTSTGMDEEQLRNSTDAYQIQSRDGHKKIQSMLQKGGFGCDGNSGSAVPVFDQYDNFRHNIRDPQRDLLRQRTAEMFHQRNPLFISSE